MDSFEINKIIAAILLVALLLIGIGKVSDVIFHVESPKTQGYSVKVDQVSNLTDTQNDQKVEETEVDISTEWSGLDAENKSDFFVAIYKC